MPAGCTALAVAFQIHTFLGSHSIGAKVNHKLVPLSHKLQSGDQVEILSSKSQHVQPSWINFVSTAKAKGKIQSILRRQNRETQKKGEEVLQEWLKRNQLEMTSSTLEKLCELHDIKKADSLLQSLGDKTVLLNEKDADELRGKNKQQKQARWKKFVPFINSGKKFLLSRRISHIHIIFQLKGSQLTPVGVKPVSLLVDRISNRDICGVVCMLIEQLHSGLIDIVLEVLEFHAIHVSRRCATSTLATCPKHANKDNY
jgi:GTP pyrophosphokinase